MLSWPYSYLLWVGLGLITGPSLFSLLRWSFWESYIHSCFYIGIGCLLYPIGWSLNITQTLPILVRKKREELHGTAYNIMDDIK
jgi:hypothetical protein